MKLRLALAVSTLLAAPISGTAAAADEPSEPRPRRPLEIGDYFRQTGISDPRLSPDGRWLAYVAERTDLEENESHTRIWMVAAEADREDREPIPMTAAGKSASREELSPFNRVDKVVTPTLIVCREKDWNVPVINSEQLFMALKRLGRTTELIVYPGEFHGISTPSFIQDRYERYLDWFERFVKNGSGEPAAGPDGQAPAN